MRAFIGLYATEDNLIMAASTLSLIPLVVLFLSCQKYFVQGIATNGLKG